MSHFVQEILDDIIKLDPDLQKVEKDLEHLIKELIKDKPETPFTQEFKESLKAQIVGAINEQKILHEEKTWDWQNMMHSLKFRMFSMSSIAVVAIFFVIFSNIPVQISSVKISPVQISPVKIIQELSPVSPEIPVQISQDSSPETSENISISNGNGASRNVDNVMMIAIPEETINTETTVQTFSQNVSKDFSETANTETVNTEAMSAKMADYSVGEDITKTLCETSKQFLSQYSLDENSENTTKIFTYDNQTYETNIDFTNNNISIHHKNTQDNITNQTEIPNLNLFFDSNNFDIKSDYNSAIVEDKANTIEYYYPRYNQQEGITVIIDKATNSIFSVNNICIYK